ncbi:DUF6421 family protein [Nocardia sp. NBC_00511]|uniref:DUF6421 family protein n=1 Tax=Nocardia sp. NBC_00511 TaxID=2903591 RepID=UPI002F9130E2
MTPSFETGADSAWIGLKSEVNSLRLRQISDGRIDPGRANTVSAHRAVWRVADSILQLAPNFPHDGEYLDAVVRDLRNWARDGFNRPDFSRSMRLFQPDRRRADGRTHLAVFPMYARNGNGQCRYEAMLVSQVWPHWLEKLEQTYHPASIHVPLMVTDFTAGFEPESGLCYPDTVSASPHGGDRADNSLILFEFEAARFRSVCAAMVRPLNLALDSEVAAAIEHRRTAHHAFLALGLLREQTSGPGHVSPRSATRVQRGPYWMRALDELRRDLSAYLMATDLAPTGHPVGLLVPGVLLLDRAFRAPLSGGRWENFDSLAGQILFGCLRDNDVFGLSGGQMYIDDDRATQVIAELADAIDQLFSDNSDMLAPTLWAAGHELISRYVPASEESTWSHGTATLSDALPDEFPLDVFFEHLASDMPRAAQRHHPPRGSIEAADRGVGHSQADRGTQ